VFKIPFLFLRPQQALLAFQCTMADLGGTGEVPSAVESALGRIPNLTPGDFAAVRRRLLCPSRAPTAENLLAELQAEVRVKESTAGRIGF